MSIHAYVFMTNHMHLLATGSSVDSISTAIQALGRRYVRYFNFIHDRSGTLWQGRFRSSVVDTDRYFLVCQRYIELNPVRAGACSHPGEFPWSSYRHYARGVSDDLVTPHSIHATYDASRYRQIFPSPPNDDEIQVIRDSINSGLPLGDDAFRERIGAQTGQRTERARQGRPRLIPENQPELV